ncbi:MAG TPA: aminopeptidase N [Candidatus Omnitrophica bacterium]|nr:aminopeptidase N [Candidatus Omnitrophota bacterium]
MISPVKTTSEKPSVIHLKDYSKPDYSIRSVELDFTIESAEKVTVVSRIQIARSALNQDGKKPLILNGTHLKLVEVRLNEELLSSKDYQVTDKELILASVPTAFELSTTVEINPKANLALEGVYAAGSVLCTQCEAEGFRRITYFMDRPDVITQYKVRLTADAKTYPVLLSNGNLKEEKMLADGRKTVLFDDPFPKPSYLFALVAGNLKSIRDTYVTKSGKSVNLEIYAEPGSETKCAHALLSLKQSIKWDEDTFGLECDLDDYKVVAVDAFNSGAMENKGLNIFNSQYVLAKPETATDMDYQNIQGVIGHEYFHNWTGNRVTCRDWFQLTLKEGLTVFRDEEFSSDMNDRSVKRISDVRVLRDHQFPEDGGPNAHPIRPQSYIQIRNFYTATVYNKGAEVIRMIQTFIGIENFKKGITKYFELYDGQAVTTDDFVNAMELASGKNLSAFKNSWYEQAGTPTLKVRGIYDAAKKNYALEVEQSVAPNVKLENPKPFVMPLSLGLLDSAGKEILPTQICEIKDWKHRFEFPNITAKPIPSLLRDFSAPVHLDYPYLEEDLAHLMAYDTDDFTRYDAGQRLAEMVLFRRIEAVQKGQSFAPETVFFEAFSKLLCDSKPRAAFKAEALLLPSLSGLVEKMTVCDFDAVFKARESLLTDLASKNESAWIALHDQNAKTGKYEITSQAMGERALKNRALAALVQLEKASAYELAWKQFQTATNMTDEIASLSILVNSRAPQKEEALNRFYAKWKHEFLVINKWLIVQAGSKEEQVIDRVRNLAKHECYQTKNPNMIRSLYGVFARNLPRFHALNGEGYQLIADQLIAIDEFNSQIAGRMIPVFNHYKKLDSVRKGLMKAALEKILNRKECSPDVYEMVSKTLKDT